MFKLKKQDEVDIPQQKTFHHIRSSTLCNL